jgi:hypothetical protein
MSPPTNDEAHAGPGLGDTEQQSTDNHTNTARVYRRRGLTLLRHAPQDTLSQMKRRQAAAARLVPLDCGCPTGRHSDPLSCLCTFPPLTDDQLDGWKAAALHVLSTSRIPVLPIEVRRALWRRGGRDRVLAERLHEACGGGAA